LWVLRQYILEMAHQSCYKRDVVRKIFVDCSYLVTHTELNTGIQRVVRKIIENLEKIAKDSGEFKGVYLVGY